MQNVTRVFGIAIVGAIGAGLYIASATRDRDSWVPIEIGFNVTSPTTMHDSFTARPGGNYHVGIALDDSPTARCWLEPAEAHGCEVGAAPQELYYTWQVTSDGRPVSSPALDRGVSAVNYNDGRLTARVGSWRDTAGARYNVAFTTLAPAPEIAALSPAFLIELGPRLRTQDMLVGASVRLLGLGLVLWSAWRLVMVARHRASRRLTSTLKCNIEGQGT